MPDKKQILNSIAAIAKKLGRAPSVSEFVAHAGTSWYFVSRFFPKWNDAVRAAGLEPRRLRVRPEDSELLNDWAQTVRKKRTIPTQYGYRRCGKYDPRTLEERFGGWSSVPQAFRNYAKGKRQWRDVLALLPDPIPEETRVQVAPCRGALHPVCAGRRVPTSVIRTSSGVRHYKTLKDRATCGNPMEYCGLRHEPVNEQGIVLLFGMLAKDLGYVIEAVQTGFPDCEAKRQSGAGRWQRVNIEFEFESKNFRQHGHPSTGCDVIVCWRHNWNDCPKHIEVVELSSVVKSLANSKD